MVIKVSQEPLALVIKELKELQVLKELRELQVLKEPEAEEQRLAMPPPPPRLSRREKALAAVARDRQLMPPSPPRLSVENSLANITII
jgi:hypothetical protein